MVTQSAKLQAFGKFLQEKRIEKRIGLREMCRKTNFDPSNYSKIERGVMAPPSDQKTLAKWTQALGIKNNSQEFHEFVDYALIAQDIIPQVLPEAEMLKLMPAFFRTVRNEKPRKQDLDNLIKLIKKSTQG